MERLVQLGLKAKVSMEMLMEAAEELDGRKSSGDIRGAPDGSSPVPSPSNPVMHARSARILSELNDMAEAGKHSYS